MSSAAPPTTTLSAVLLADTSDAAITITISQAGADVQAIASGTLDVMELTPQTFRSATSQIAGRFDFIGFGSGVQFYYTGLTGPSSFGSGYYAQVSSTSGTPLVVVEYAGAASKQQVAGPTPTVIAGAGVARGTA